MFRIAACATTVLAISASAVAAAPAIGLVADRTLVMFDTETLAVSGSKDVADVDRLLGIDVRPSNGQLVGVTADFVVVSIDPATGATTPMSTMDKPLPIDGMPVVVDFNPAADKLRFMSGATNHRVDVDTGAVTVDGSLAFEGDDMHVGETPAIVAAAYINSRGKPEKTAMYDIDSTIVALIRQTSPNDGTLAAVGKLGIADAADGFAFDVHTSADMTNTAWLVNGNMLYGVDLETGAADGKGAIEGVDGDIRDIAVLPTE